MWQAPTEEGGGCSHRSLEQQTTGGWKKIHTKKHLKGLCSFPGCLSFAFWKMHLFSLIRSRVQLIHPTQPPFPACSCCGGILHQLGCLLYTGWKEKKLKMARFSNKDPKAVDNLNHIEELDGDLTTHRGSPPVSAWLWSFSSVHRCRSLLPLI